MIKIYAEIGKRSSTIAKKNCQNLLIKIDLYCLRFEEKLYSVELSDDTQIFSIYLSIRCPVDFFKSSA